MMAAYLYVPESSDHGLIRIALARADKPPQMREWAEFDTIGIFSSSMRIQIKL